MNEQQFTHELKDSCKRILDGVFMHVIDDDYIDNMNFNYHEGKITWVEYLGTKLVAYDKKAVEIIGRIMRAVCNKHNIVFLSYLKK